MLDLPAGVVDAIVAHALDAFPLECCGLLAGPATAAAGEAMLVERFYPCRNAAESARVYTVDAGDYLRAGRDADDNDWDIVGVVHSHTHTEPYPSPTDIAQAPDPDWHYVIVGLKRESPELRSYRIREGEVLEEQVAVTRQ